MSKLPDDLEELKRHPLVIQLYHKRMHLERQGSRLRGSCPFGTHSDSTPSFDVYEHEGVYIFKCLGCGVAGNIFQFLTKFDGTTMKQAIQTVREYVHGSSQIDTKEVDEYFKPLGSKEKPVLVWTLEQHKEYEDAFDQNSEARDWLFRERGITYETAKKFHIGFRQSVGKDEETKDGGWLSFPCIQGDKVVAIKYRSIVKKAFLRKKEMATEVWFNNDTIDFMSSVYVVEGEFDAMVLEQAGFQAVSLPNATTKITAEMMDRLREAGSVVLAGDNDGGVGAAVMQKLWADLGDSASYIEWPEALKDANDVFLKKCKGDILAFRELVEQLTKTAKSVVMPGIYSLQESMQAHHQADLANHPERLRFPWKNVDDMAIILPGDVLAVTATNTKMGKTAWVTQATLYSARKYKEIVLNYQCELTIDRFNTQVAALLLRKDRNHLTNEDFKEARELLTGVHYYVGSNPALTTVDSVLDLIERAIKRTGATIVVLDHIHFLCRNARDEIQTQANASQRISNLSKKYRVKFIMIEQPRKASQNQKGKKLHVTDGKGSEALHSDAAAIFSLHREVVKTVVPPPPDPLDPITEVHLLGGARAKGDGASVAMLHFIGNHAAFEEIVDIDPEELQGALDI